MTDNYFGHDVPKLGFGLMRLPRLSSGKTDMEQVKTMVDMFLAAGQKYFDTAYVYDGGNSERAAKEALVDRYPRDRFYLATKMCSWMGSNADEVKKQLDISLERTGAGYFDYYLLHSIQENNYKKYEEYGLWDFVREQKAKGKIRHWGFSFHADPEMLDELLTKYPEAEFVQLQINYADWENPGVRARQNYETARKHGKSVVVMEPVKGGLLANPPQQVKELFQAASPESSFASWAIRYSASLDGVITVLSGMSSIEQMRDNLSYMTRFSPLSTAEQETIGKVQAVLDQIKSIPCTECHYCSVCPKKINIPDIFSAMNQQLIWHLWDSGKHLYERAVAGGSKPSDCVACGRCEGVCPQHIRIIERLKECAAHFEKGKE